jgi:hypothetical protein
MLGKVELLFLHILDEVGPSALIDIFSCSLHCWFFDMYMLPCGRQFQMILCDVLLPSYWRCLQEYRSQMLAVGRCGGLHLNDSENVVYVNE